MLGGVHEYHLTILEEHLDSFGHVNNSKYLGIFEAARWDFITRHGYGLDEIVSRRIGPTILELTLKFQRELRNRQPIVVRSWIESYPKKVGRMVQQIWDTDGNLCCDALFVIGLFDLNARKLISPTPEWIKGIGLAPSDFPPAE